MTHQIRVLSGVVLVLFLALFVNLNLIQVVRAPDLINNQRNRRLLVQEYAIERGQIVVGDVPIASSRLTDDDLKYLRVYAEPERYAHLTGFDSIVVSRSGLERARNSDLIGTSEQLLAENLVDLLTFSDPVGNTLRLTIDPALQRQAQLAIGGRVGAVVAMDPRTGAVLASYSNPSYDPNLLSSHDGGAVQAAYATLADAPGGPLIDRVTRETYPPGSVFKLVVAAAALENGLTPETAFDDRDGYTAPTTSATIRNFSGSTCGDAPTITLRDALRVSCNTVFAELGVQLGSSTLVETAEAFGFNASPPYDLDVVASAIPKQLDPPATAQSALGQRDVRATPLEVALLTSAIVNGGELVRPYLVERVEGPDLGLVSGPRNGPWAPTSRGSQAISELTAEQVRDMMVAVVQSGTGRAAQIANVVVGGKTGTAEVPGESSTVWFTGFVEDQLVVTVVLPDAGVDATGGGAAAPIARAVMETFLGRRS